MAVLVLLLLLLVQDALPAIVDVPKKAVQDGVDPLDVVPETFLIGAGVSAAQAEGAAWEGGKGESVVDFMSVENKYRASPNVSADHYHRYREDLALAKGLGVRKLLCHGRTHRFSFSWARLFPDGDFARPNSIGVAFYHDYIDELRKNDIEPLATMYHWDHPMVVERRTRGWTSPEIVDEFVEFITFLYKTYGRKIKYWNPFNEGNMYCIFMLGELAKAGSTPLDESTYYKCLHHTILAHAKAYKAYEPYRAEQKGFVGTSTLIWPASPADPNAPEDIEAARMFNDVFGATPVHPIVYGGEYPTTTRYLTDKRSKELGLREPKLPRFTPWEKDQYFSGRATDFLAINVYSGFDVSLARNASDVGRRPSVIMPVVKDIPEVKVISGGDLELRPDMMRISLLWAWENYQLPIIITETGYGDFVGAGIRDSVRADYHGTALRSLVRTMNEFQIPVISYYVWSLLDVFEFSGGYDGRPFGLIHVDYANKTLRRTLKESCKLFMHIAETGRVPPRSAASSTKQSAPTALLLLLLLLLLTATHHFR